MQSALALIRHIETLKFANLERNSPTMSMLYHKVFTPEELQALITRAPASGTETEVQIGADSMDREVILKHELLKKINPGDDLTVKINAAFEYKGHTELYILVSGDEDAIGFKLNDPSDYGTAPYQGVFGKAYGRQFDLDSTSSKPEPVVSRRWPQQFQITLKPARDDPWGMCYTALDGGHSYSSNYARGIRSRDPLNFCLYRGGRTGTYTINFIEITVYKDNN